MDVLCTSEELLSVSGPVSLPACAGRGLDRIFRVPSNSDPMALEAWAVPGCTQKGWGVGREELSEGLGKEGCAIKQNANFPGSNPGKEEQLSNLKPIVVGGQVPES